MGSGLVEFYCCGMCSWRGLDYTAWLEHVVAAHSARFGVIRDVGPACETIVFGPANPTLEGKQEAP
jgi:hypothetical protein